MGMRFNSPPGWPPPPEGWMPPAGWMPDPTLPPLPPGWQLFVDDYAPPPVPAATVGYPTTPMPVMTTPIVQRQQPLDVSPAATQQPLLPTQVQHPRPAVAAGPLGKDRSPAAVLGLSIITLGIYYLVWYGKINGEIRRHDPDIRVRPALAVIAAMLPIFNIVSAYSTAARIRQMQLDAGQQQTISPVVALLLFLFLGIGFPLYLASQLREFWHGQRRLGR
jgi:hypothetical protein